MTPPDAGITAWLELVSKFGFGIVAVYLIWFKVMPILEHLKVCTEENTKTNRENGEHLKNLLMVVIGRRQLEENIDLVHPPKE